MLLLLLLLAGSAQAVSLSPPPLEPKAPLLEKLKSICLKNSLAEGKNQAQVCECMKANYQKLQPAELAALVKILAGQTPKEELGSAENEAAMDFDQLASEKCLGDANWRWQPEPALAPGSDPAPAPAPAKAPKKAKN